jgi:hypothetical protein
MVKTVVVVDSVTNKATNFILVDENSPILEGTYYVDFPDNTYIKFGYTWDGTQFLDEEGLPAATGSIE